MGTPAESPILFSGDFRLVLDPKNRITIPARWREKGGAQELHLVPEPNNTCLLVMPPTEFAAVGQRVNESNTPAPKKKVFFRNFYSRARSVTVDKQGRLLIPEELRSLLKLESEIWIAGTGARFEIWNVEAWMNQRAADQDDYTDTAINIGGL